jgi:hypothetical protein
MGKPKPEKSADPEKAAAPVTPENAEVQAAGEAERRRLQQQNGRQTTYQVNPIAGGQFANMRKKRTGD